NGPSAAVTSPYPVCVPLETLRSTMCRSCVAPKLVSNGCKSRIRSSRISMCSMNTRCSGNKKVFARFITAFESGNEVIVMKVLQEFMANASLYILCRLQAMLFQLLDIGWNAYAANLTFDERVRLIDPPFCDQTIAFQSFLQL